jgi:hypothetical protein
MDKSRDGKDSQKLKDEKEAVPTGTKLFCRQFMLSLEFYKINYTSHS